MKILCAAIHFDDNQKHIHQPKNIDTGFVVTGRRHHNVFSLMSIIDTEKKYKEFKIEQGFLTDNDLFVDRYEGAKIAKEANQCHNSITILYSEDLY